MVHKVFYLLQKDIKLNTNICNINVLIDKFINLYDNSNIDCNKKIIKINYMHRTDKYRQMHLTDKCSQHSSIIWPVWLNG